MTANEFLISKGAKSVGNQFPAGVISKWLEEYANYKIDKVFYESINVKSFQGIHKFIELIDYKKEILYSIKNK